MNRPYLAENDQKSARVELISPGISDIQRSDMVAVEAPLELRIHDKPATILMRTPGHDLDLALGFLFHEGIISTSDQVLGVERPEPEHPDYDNILNIRLAIPSRAKSLDRFFFSTSSCGACGKKSLDAVAVQSQPVSGNFIVSPAFLSTLPGMLRPHQELFSQTGGVHACELFTPAENSFVCARMWADITRLTRSPGLPWKGGYILFLPVSWFCPDGSDTKWRKKRSSRAFQ